MSRFVIAAVLFATATSAYLFSRSAPAHHTGEDHVHDVTVVSLAGGVGMVDRESKMLLIYKPDGDKLALYGKVDLNKVGQKSIPIVKADRHHHHEHLGSHHDHVTHSHHDTADYGDADHGDAVDASHDHHSENVESSASN